MKKIVVKQAPTEEIPTEVLATHIKSIAEGIRKLRSGRLNDRALYLLVQHAAPISVGIGTIKAIFDGIDRLEQAYLRKKAS